MKIRIAGTDEELTAITELLQKYPFIKSISKPYKNRGYTDESRLYIDTYNIRADSLQPCYYAGMIDKTPVIYRALPGTLEATEHYPELQPEEFQTLAAALQHVKNLRIEPKD